MTKSGKHCGKRSARFEQFVLCHYVFIKPSAAEMSESAYMRERVNFKVIRCRFVVNGKRLTFCVICMLATVIRQSTVYCYLVFHLGYFLSLSQL